ncbi:MAG: penicillin-binding protein 1C [Deltaproteobacteria bacterium]|jgi:penicillin-binding protein 1C|nr:penicillin-binding protein 1C [Deltaproteobacteria bacterium]
MFQALFFKNRFPRRLRLAALLTFLSLTLVFLGLWVYYPAVTISFPVSPTVKDFNGRLLNARLAADEQWLFPVKLTDMGPWLPLLAVTAEDGRFWDHLGVDPLAIARALAQNAKALRIVSGASTITVQVTRLLNPAPRTLSHKVREFIQALKLERKLSKPEILELYLNLAPFGGNLKGVGAASWAYFQKQPKDLSLAESATLIAILRGPAWYRPDRHPARAKARRDLILERLAKKGVINSSQKDQAQNEPLIARRLAFPNKAPRFAALALKTAKRSWRWGEKGFSGLITSLDTDKQEFLAHRLNQALAPFPPNVAGAGALLDNQTGAVLAYVGNARPKGPAGLVDCAQALRSPGSTLKPFIYLEAMAEGSITPATLLADTPLGLRGEAPRNYDRHYRGPVSARLALADSLNAPAVRVLRLIGLKKAQKVLATAGFTLTKGRSYGDSLVLGGGEVTLMELLRAYAILGRGGSSVEISLAPTNPSPGRKVFREEAVWLINSVLTDPTRLPYGLGGEGWAFKTGTSHGFRDAWLAIYNPRYTAILWLGEVNGQGLEGLSGLKALGQAAALFTQDLGAKTAFPKPPKGLELFEACPLSGAPRGPFCPPGRLTYRLKDRRQTLTCGLHQKKDGRLVTVWPPELAGFMASREATSPAPLITSPLNGAVIRLNDQKGGVPLKSESTVGPIHWYVDEEFFMAARPGLTPVLPLTPGVHRVSLVDGRGQTAVSVFTAVTARRDAGRILRLVPSSAQTASR